MLYKHRIAFSFQLLSEKMFILKMFVRFLNSYHLGFVYLS